MKLKLLIGSGEKIGLFTLPFIIIGLILNIIAPYLFSVGGPSAVLKNISLIILFIGIINWIWSAILIITKVPNKELITSGPYAIVKHPLYTGFAFLVIPWLGFLLNSWLGVVIGIIVYIGSRQYAPEEEKILEKNFGPAWDTYCKKVLIPWL